MLLGFKNSYRYFFREVHHMFVGELLERLQNSTGTLQKMLQAFFKRFLHHPIRDLSRNCSRNACMNHWKADISPVFFFLISFRCSSRKLKDFPRNFPKQIRNKLFIGPLRVFRGVSSGIVLQQICHKFLLELTSKFSLRFLQIFLERFVQDPI